MSASRQVLALVAWLLVSYSAGALGAIASTNADTFYVQLTRPGWAPPSWLFGPVWTFLYTLMGIAAWLVWRERGFRGAQPALALFLVHLVFNALWSWLFFAWQRGALAFAEIIILLLLIVATIAAFWRVKPLAAALLVPYLLWVAYAAALTYALWRANPQVL